MSLEYTRKLKEKCDGHRVLDKAFRDLVQEATNTHQAINDVIKASKNISQEEKKKKIAFLETQFEGFYKIPFCSFCRYNGVETKCSEFNLYDLCNTAI